MPLSRLENLLKSGRDDSLEQIVRKAREMDDLAGHLRKYLAADMAQHLVAANLRENGELVLVCSTSAWAARLRYETDMLRQAAKDAGKSVTKCVVRVQSPDGAAR